MSEPATPGGASPGRFARAFAVAWNGLREGVAKLRAALKTPEVEEDERDSYARELRERIFHPPEW